MTRESAQPPRNPLLPRGTARRVLGLVAGAAGVAVAGAAVGAVRRRRVVARRDVEDSALGTLHSPPVTVVADDGVALCVEVDEAPDSESPLTVVFLHGYALNLDCWHFQRAGYRGLVRTVYYDHRSHGRSGRSDARHATIDQLGRDLAQVLETVVPTGPVVLVGHSMGGMTIVAMAEQQPELFGDRVVGVALISTTAGGLDPSRILLPLLPARLGGPLTSRVVSALARGHTAVDGVRRLGKSIATLATDVFAFGGDVPQAYIDFVDAMLAATPFEVVAEFFPSFRNLDKFDAIEVMSRIPTTVLCGTSDRLTAIGHSRKLASRIAGSRLVECEGAGHMVILERHQQVNSELDQLLAAATAGIGSR